MPQEIFMSIFSTIITDLKSFASKVETEFKKLFSEAPSWLVIAQGVLTYLGPIVVAIADVAGNAALGAEANTILADIKTKLATAAALVATVSNATSVTDVLMDIQADLPSLLSALQVSNPTTVVSVTNYIDIIGTEITALLNAIPARTTTATA
jgi:hypothetical protein